MSALLTFYGRLFGITQRQRHAEKLRRQHLTKCTAKDAFGSRSEMFGALSSRGTRTPSREGGGIIGEVLGAWIKVRRKKADRW